MPLLPLRLLYVKKQTLCSRIAAPIALTDKLFVD